MSDESENKLVEFHDIWVALSLLSRLPVPVDHDVAGKRAANASWAYPVAGGLMGLVAGLVGWSLMAVGFSAGISAGVALIVLVMISGALHEDGLADCADGLWGGTTTVNRLAIMKDSRIGVYGTLALILFIGLRWQAISVQTDVAIIQVMVLVGAISRMPLPWIMAKYENARTNGLSKSVGTPSQQTVMIGFFTGAVVAVLAVGLTGLLAFLAAGLIAILLIRYVQTKITGQTGDILGGIQQVVETALLILMTVII